MSLDAKTYTERQGALTAAKESAQEAYDKIERRCRVELHKAGESQHAARAEAEAAVRETERDLHAEHSAAFFRAMTPLVQGIEREGYPRPLVRDFCSAVKAANARAVEELGAPLPVVAVGFAFAANYPDAAAVFGLPPLWADSSGCLKECEAVVKAAELDNAAMGEVALRALEGRLGKLVRAAQQLNLTQNDRERILRRFDVMKGCATAAELTRRLEAFDKAEQDERTRAWAESYVPKVKTAVPAHDDAAWARIEREAERLGGGLIGRAVRKVLT